MNREDIIRMAQEAGEAEGMAEFVFHPVIERFAALVASAERERIKQANAPEIERINAHIKELEDAVKEALAQPKQEPVAFINVEQRKLEWAKYMSWDTPTVVNLPKIPLYTTPPQRTWVGLTEQDKMEISDKLGLMDVAWLDLMDAIEAKLKEKNI